MSTFGPAYDGNLDGDRVNVQMERIKKFMLWQPVDVWNTLGEIEAATGDPQASISSQLRHLRKKKFGAFTVEKRRRAGADGLWEYRVWQF